LFLEVVLGVWTIVLFVVGVSEVQKFSIWKAILNILLPVLLLLAVIVLVVLVVKMF